MRIDLRRLASALGLACLITSSAACDRKSTSNAVTDDSAVAPLHPDSATTSAAAILPDSVRPRDQAAATRPQPRAADTARGIVRRYGAEPLTRLGLAPIEGSRAELLALSGSQMSELAAAEGIEVTVSGERTSERAFDVAPGGAIVFRVARFVVRAVDGVPARDGVLVDVGGQPFLETAPGVHERIIRLPTALKSQTGARVFLVGPPDRAPQSFGVLRAP